MIISWQISLLVFNDNISGISAILCVNKMSLNILKGQQETVNRRRTDYTGQKKKNKRINNDLHQQIWDRGTRTQLHTSSNCHVYLVTKPANKKSTEPRFPIGSHHKWPRIYPACRNHLPILSLIMTYHRVCTWSNGCY